jgi:hypothetical protein
VQKPLHVALVSRLSALGSGSGIAEERVKGREISGRRMESFILILLASI